MPLYEYTCECGTVNWRICDMESRDRAMTCKECGKTPVARDVSLPQSYIGSKDRPKRGQG